MSTWIPISALQQVNLQNPLPVTEIPFGHPGSRDAFGSLRVSSRLTLFDSKLLHDSAPLFWDDAETSGSGTSSTYNGPDDPSVSISVSDSIAGTRVRQTFQRFNYQPGKGQHVLFTGILGSAATGLTCRVGQFDEGNGLFFEQDEDGPSVVVRSKVSGAVVETRVRQADWELDRLDGSGGTANPSEITLDLSKVQIFVLDFEWLSVGAVLFGFLINGNYRYCHVFHFSNVGTSSYSSTPNLPLRYEVSNDGSGPAASMKQICSSVESEGGQSSLGLVLGDSTDDGNVVTCSASGTLYAAFGFRLKSTYPGAVNSLESISFEPTSSNKAFAWQLRMNPTVTGTFTFNDLANASIQVAKGNETSPAPTASGGTILLAGFGEGNTTVTRAIPNLRWVGSAIDGTRDRFVICVRPLATNVTLHVASDWRELA